MGKRTSSKKGDSQSTAASLSNFLLSAVEDKDNQLDNIFANSKGPSVAFQAKPEQSKKSSSQSKSELKSKSTKGAHAATVQAAQDSEGDNDDEDEEGAEVANDEVLSELDSNESLGLPSDDEDDEDDAGVEEAYAAKLVAERLKALNEKKKEKQSNKRKAEEELSDDDEQEKQNGDGSGDEQEDDDDDLDIDDIFSQMPGKQFKEVAKTTKEIKKDQKNAAKIRAHADETPEERDARTLFIGNVPVACSTSKSMKKALIRHVLTSPAVIEALPKDFPKLRCDAIRFRSLAFASTVFGRKADAVDPETGEKTEAGGRGRKRARAWRENEDSDLRGVKGGARHREKSPEAPVQTGKGALTDGQKRRVAFIRGELNEGKKVCNAYLVLDRLPEGALIQLPYAEIIKVLVEVTTGSAFEGHYLRADIVRPKSTAALVAAAQMAARPNLDIKVAETGPIVSVPAAEARRTLFVGGLDFAENEENVRAATEAVMVRERGDPGLKPWVEGVRIIRDASSGLGKGFGYILLKDDSCVDELLALEPGKNLKVSKRKVRLERCKTGIAAARAKAAAATRETKKVNAAAGSASAGTKIGAPRDPTLKKYGPGSSSAGRSSASSGARPSTSASEHQAKLAEALAKLPPSERKAIKAVDPERLQRRALKKKNKVLSERYERKMSNLEKKGNVLGRETRGEARNRKEKKRVAAGNKTGKRAKKI